MTDYDSIYTAIKYGDTTTLQAYLDSVTEDQISYPLLKRIDSFLAHAVNHSQLDILKLLVEYGASLDQPFNGSILLEYAIQIGNRSIIDYLVGIAPEE